MVFSQISSFFSPNAESIDVAAPWLLMLRWGELLCQLLLITTVVLFMEMQVPLFLVLFIFLFEVLSNLFLHAEQKKNGFIANRLVVIILLLDTIALTLLLNVTGGVMNPFVFLYLLHIVLGAIILEVGYSWLITITTLLCYGLLFYFPQPVIHDLSGASKLSDLAGCHIIDGIPGSFQLHLQGMWLAFAITSLFIVFFVSKIQKALAKHRVTLSRLEKEKVRNEKLSSLATLAAGAAHELSTPLSTVAVVSKEMYYVMEEESCSNELLEDAKLIRQQVADCKEILYQMTASAGEHLGEELGVFSVNEIIEHTLKGISKEKCQQIRVDVAENIPTLSVPFRSLCRTVRGLLINGLEASLDDSSVYMDWSVSAENLLIKVSDEGEGISESDCELVINPFFTTKASGLGLGLFLAKNLAEQFYGDLTITSRQGVGTMVMIRLPLESLTGKV